VCELGTSSFPEVADTEVFVSYLQEKSEGKGDRQTYTLEFLRKDTNTLDVKHVSEILHCDRQQQSLQTQTSPTQNHPEEQ